MASLTQWTWVWVDPISVLCIQMAPELVASPHCQNLAPDLSPVDPQIWDTEAPSVSRHHSPVRVFLKNPSQVITQTQYTLPTESRQGLKPIMLCAQAWKPGSQHAGEKRGVAGLLLGRTERAARAAELQLCTQAR